MLSNSVIITSNNIQFFFSISIFFAIIFCSISKLSSNSVIEELIKNLSVILSALIIIVPSPKLSLIQIPFLVITAKYFLSPAYLFLIFKYSFLRIDEKL